MHFSCPFVVVKMRIRPLANDHMEGSSSSKKRIGDSSRWMKIAFFLCKIRFRTHMFILWGQSHNQKNHQKLTVRVDPTPPPTLRSAFRDSLCAFNFRLWCSETDFTQEKGHSYPTTKNTIPSFKAVIKLAAALSQNGRIAV